METWWHVALVIAGGWLVCSLLFAGVFAVVAHRLKRGKGDRDHNDHDERAGH